MPDNQPKTLTYKILQEHLVEGTLLAQHEIAIRIDQTLTQDATGTTAMLLCESMNLKRVKTDLSVSYVDHNMAMVGPENHQDHLYLQSIARKLGAYHSRPGNGICHQVHLERFAQPGATLLGSDSHTPTAGGIGALAIGAGGLDVAVAMGGGPFYLAAPRVIGIKLTGQLQPYVAAKDVILKVLSILTTKGNVGAVAEYFGPGVASLSVPERATITNMGAELGVTTSLFPADDRTRDFLNAQKSPDAFLPLAADADAPYDRIIEIDLARLEPRAAAPSSPDNIKKMVDLPPTPVCQVLIGSCTNSSFADLATVAAIMKGKKVHPQVEFALAPGSQQVLRMLAEAGHLADLLASGARLLEAACGPCIGQGQSPSPGKASVRTFNRNFKGRSGTKDDLVYLTSPQTAAAAALTGQLIDPRKLPQLLGIPYPDIPTPASFPIDDGMIEPPLPPEQAKNAPISRADTIVTPPAAQVPPAHLDGTVLIHCPDKTTTDHIMPAGPFLKYRSNVPQYAQFVFHCFNDASQPTFAQRALDVKNAGHAGIIVAGLSYGQGSSREHAALCPMFLGVKLVLAKSMERIHRANLVNFAIVPATFDDPADYDRIAPGDHLAVENFLDAVKNAEKLTIKNLSRNLTFTCSLTLTNRERAILAAGGKLNYTT